MSGVRLSALRLNTVCLVLVWQSAADWTRQRLTKANVGPKKANQDGRQPTVFPRFYRPQVQKFKTLPSLLIHLHLNAIKFLDFDTP